MMKKALMIFFILSYSWLLCFSYVGKNVASAASEYTVIPDEAIRLRILANSNENGDQALKREIRDNVNHEINLWVADLTSFAEGREVIKSHLGDIEQIVANTIKENNSTQTYKVELRKDVPFPTKLYGDFLYPAGNYEAVLITLGNGEGANWWCVLFPPLCFLDFSNGDAVQDLEEQDTQKEQIKSEEKSANQKVETRFFLKDVYDSLF